MTKVSEDQQKALLKKLKRNPQILQQFAATAEIFPKLGKNIDILEDHIILVQKNQKEFEGFLRDILKNQDRLLNNVQKLHDEVRLMTNENDQE